MKKQVIVMLSAFLITSSIYAQGEVKQDKTYREEISSWINKRDSTLRSLASPLSIAGVFPLKEGENSFGTASDNDVVFPPDAVAAHAGQYIVRNDSVLVELAGDARIISKGREAIRVAEIPVQDSLKYRSNEQSIVLTHGDYKWFVLLSGGKPTLRLLNVNSEEHHQFKGVKRFTSDKKWLLQARFEPYTSLTKIPITTVKGKTDERKSAGRVHFFVDGQPQTLEALDVDGQLFIVFADKTSGHESYAFRFLYANRPVNGDTTVLDFNKATNPNCAFSKYSACPLPPAGNRLTIAIPAGEKKYESPVQ